MPDDLAVSVEPDTALVCECHVRRNDHQDALASTILALLEPEGVVVDLSRYDRRADIVELRTTHPSSPRSE